MNSKIIILNVILMNLLIIQITYGDYGCGIAGNTCNYECFRYCVVAGYGSGGCQSSKCMCSWTVINETQNALQLNPNLNTNNNNFNPNTFNPNPNTNFNSGNNFGTNRAQPQPQPQQPFNPLTQGLLGDKNRTIYLENESSKEPNSS